jgi:hypothetical protein
MPFGAACPHYATSRADYSKNLRLHVRWRTERPGRNADERRIQGPGPPLTDIQTLRKGARQHIEAGAVGGAVIAGGSTAGTIGGAAVGGIIGNQIGKDK